MSQSLVVTMASMATAKKALAPVKKTPAKKAAVTATARAPRPRTAASAKAATSKARSIVVEGRSIEVKLPSVEQLMAWKETLEAISTMQVNIVEYEKIRVHIDRYYKIATGLFVHQADKDWLQDGRLDGTISIEKDSVLGMITNVLEVYGDLLPGGPANRAEKRAAVRKRA